jgi:hypothetical protein
MDGRGEKLRVRDADGCGAVEAAENCVACDREVEGVDGVDAEEFADEVSAALAVEGADLVGRV